MSQTQWHWPRYAVRATVVDVMGTGVCPYGLKKGDSWTWRWHVPDGMCPWLAYALFPFFQSLTFGGNVAWEVEEGKTRVCCIDPRSPVVVELERMERMEEGKMAESITREKGAERS